MSIRRDKVRVIPCLAVLVAVSGAPALAQWTGQLSGATVEFRSLSAANENVLVAGGENGSYSRTVNGGATWRTTTLPGAASLFFVGAHAVNATTAYLLGTNFDGGHARIYKTNDGGESWYMQFADSAPGTFFDGMAFWDADHGIAFGDPVGGTFVVVTTADGGTTWRAVPKEALPAPLPGEAAFAASGTAIHVRPPGHVWIGTGGGSVARVLRSEDQGRTWSVAETPLPGGNTSGIFGLAFRDARNGVAVGGDYSTPIAATPNVLRTSDGGSTWTMAGTSTPAGVRFGVAYLSAEPPGLIAVGPAGVGVSRDEGLTWTAVDTLAYNTVAVSEGKVWVAGPGGRIAHARMQVSFPRAR